MPRTIPLGEVLISQSDTSKRKIAAYSLDHRFRIVGAKTLEAALPPHSQGRTPR